MGDTVKQRCSTGTRRFPSRAVSRKAYSQGHDEVNDNVCLTSFSGTTCCRGTSFCAACDAGINTSPSRLSRRTKRTEHSTCTHSVCVSDGLNKKNTLNEVVFVAKDQITNRYKWNAEQMTPLIYNLRERSPTNSQSNRISRSPFSRGNYQERELVNRHISPIRHLSPIRNLSPIRTCTPGTQGTVSRPMTPKVQSIDRCKSKYLKWVSMDWKAYHRLAVIENYMDDMEKTYPSLCTVHVIGKSIEGRKIKLLKVSNSNATNSAVWIDSGIHAREWIGPAVNTYVANYIVKNFHRLPTHLTNKDWYFLPVMNPDGYEYSHTENRMWRKNRAKFNGMCFGVDLNRNFSYGWGGKGSSDNPSHNFYRGPAPFSEPEACAVKNIIANSGVNFKVYITLHSYGQVIIMPFACHEDLCPSYIELLQGATAMSKAIFETNGNVYKVGISKDVMYKASGTSNDWSHGAMRIPYCYLIELRSKKHKFKVPQEEIEESGNEILNSFIALMKHVDVNTKN